MSSPKYMYLNVLTVSRTIPLSVIGAVGNTGVLFRETCITLYFASLKDMKLQLARQLQSLLTSFYSALKSIVYNLHKVQD